MVVGPGVISNFRTLGRSFGVSQMFLSSGIKSSAGFPSVTPRTICTGNFIRDAGLGTVVVGWSVNGFFFTTVTSCFLGHVSKVQLLL